MAEERLLDDDLNDDKDKKYKIRINEDGEEELYIEEGEEEEVVFDIPQLEEDDEEAALLTPEQLAEREAKKREEELARIARRDKFLNEARGYLEQGKFDDAQYAAVTAAQNDNECGEAHYLKLRAVTRDLTCFNNYDECSESAQNVARYCTEEQKASLKEISSALEAQLKECEERTAELAHSNDEGKEQRRQTFASEKKRTLIWFLAAAIPFVALLIATIVVGTKMFSQENGAYLIATIACGAVTLIAFICALVGANRFWAAARNVKLNEADTSTKAGREYLESKKQLELLKDVYNSFTK